MAKEHEPPLRRAVLALAAIAVAAGAFLGVPALKALAAARDWKTLPPRDVEPPPAPLNIIQPKYVNPSAARLLGIAHDALSDGALAERIFHEPDAVASQLRLSDNEKLVLRHMTREQFDTARADADQVRADRLSKAGSSRLPASAIDARLITERMIVGRAILAAVGRSYLEAANAHACCPWSKAIELGINAKPELYNQAFEAPSGARVLQPDTEVPRSN